MKTQQSFRVLIVDDDSTVRKVLRSRLERQGHILALAESGQEALHLAKDFLPEVLICDLRMPGMGGFEVIRQLNMPAIVITGHGDKESAIEAVETGAFAFFEKPFDLDAISMSVQRAGERYQMLQEREQLLRRLNKLCQMQDRELQSLRPLAHPAEVRMVGQSPALAELRSVLKRLSRRPHSTLLIQGESGTGKEVLAAELHHLTFAQQAQEVPFLALNCATVPQELFESELFGHEKGSFSGAHNARMGLAEAVRGGTLFLDEIGDMPALQQSKLLRFLQERKFRRVGANKDLAFKGRVIAASHKNLKNLVEAGQFREDLFYRLNIVTLEIPPLRDRREDLPELAEFLCRKHGLQGVRDAERLMQYSWPGNVRELSNWIERAAILGDYDDKHQIHAPLPERRDSPNLSKTTSSGFDDNVLAFDAHVSLVERRQALLDYYETQWIQEALTEHKGQIAPAARELGIDRKNLARRIQELGLKKSRKKAA